MCKHVLPTASKPLYQCPTCRQCPPNSTEEEDLIHMVCHCPALSKTREHLHQDLKNINPNLARLFIDNLDKVLTEKGWLSPCPSSLHPSLPLLQQLHLQIPLLRPLGLLLQNLQPASIPPAPQLHST